MQLASTLTPPLIVTIASVYLVLKVRNVKSSIDLVNSILAGIMVFFFLLSHDYLYLISVRGTCNETSTTTFVCSCEQGWTGIRCETMVNYCDRVKCENRAVCRPLLRNYSCECLDSSYSGRHCENVATLRVVRQTVCKSFGYVAILSLVFVVGFVVVMDILKYGFGIDPVKEEREKIRRAKAMQRRKHRPVIQRFTYFNETPQQQPESEPKPEEESSDIHHETAV